MRLLLPALVFSAAQCSAVAGPLEGDLFGYKLGTKYPVTAQTKGYFQFLGHWVIAADKPEKPNDLGPVELIATAKSKTIGTVYSNTEFASEPAAKEFASKYSDLLGTLYAGKCTQLDKFLNENLRMRCNDYELSVLYFKPDKPTEKHKVHVTLSFYRTVDAPKWKAMQSLFKTELAEAEAEGKQYRLEQARKAQNLKGLQ